jgi:hypothetical protein
MLRGFRIWLLVGGAALAWYGFKEWRLASVTKAEPQRITCAALERDGYGDNAHVLITDFLMSPTGFVYSEGKQGSGWKAVYVPLVPLDGSYAAALRDLPKDQAPPAPGQFGVILKTERAPNEAALVRLGDSDTLLGVVINEIDALDAKTKDLLARGYPGIDLDACWIVEDRRTVKGSGTGLGLLAGGLALLVLGAWLLYRRFRPAS